MCVRTNVKDIEESLAYLHLSVGTAATALRGREAGHLCAWFLGFMGETNLISLDTAYTVDS